MSHTTNNIPLKYDWTLPEIEAIYTLPLPDLIYRAQTAHRAYHRPDEVQGCMLLSIKTGGCPEDCAYCPQSAHYDTGLNRSDLMAVEDVLAAAQNARAQGATRFCMGAAWRDAPAGEKFDRVLEMVRGVRALGLEACCTLGMLSAEQAEALGVRSQSCKKEVKGDRFQKIESTKKGNLSRDDLSRRDYRGCQ